MSPSNSAETEGERTRVCWNKLGQAPARQLNKSDPRKQEAGRAGREPPGSHSCCFWCLWTGCFVPVCGGSVKSEVLMSIPLMSTFPVGSLLPRWNFVTVLHWKQASRRLTAEFWGERNVPGKCFEILHATYDQCKVYMYSDCTLELGAVKTSKAQVHYESKQWFKAVFSQRKESKRIKMPESPPPFICEKMCSWLVSTKDCI